jgi:glycosyltransferase involved in cell wall biosynthesis
MGSTYGWGIAGTRINEELARLTELTVYPLGQQQVTQSLSLLMGEMYRPVKEVDMPVLHALGPTFIPINPNVWSTKRDVGYCFIEDLAQADLFRDNAWRWSDVVVAGSHWNASQLTRVLGRSVPVVWQGVDCDFFEAEDFQKCHPDRFVVFSGGKFEFRKSQDVVIKAFKIFSHHHPDALLLNCWNNPWKFSEQTMLESKLIQYDAALNISENTLQNISTNLWSLDYVLDRVSLRYFYKQADVALFPNRCEAGTNLVLMECMASGVPVIATHATGHIDVLSDDHAYLARDLTPIPGHPHWMEPNVDEIVSLLERAYTQKTERSLKAEKARKFIRNFSWAKTAQQLLKIAEE